MPRRPNTKNLPSRIFEESNTPIYLIDAELSVVYVNPSLARLFGVERDEIVGRKLKYLADVDPSDPQARFYSLCPPPELIARPANESSDPTPANFSVLLPDGQRMLATCSTIEDPTAGRILVCSLIVSPHESETNDSSWLHQRIQRFRLKQSSRFHAIPYLGDSDAAQRCFAQARSYALLESNVAVVGHPNSQAMEVAKSIHYSGFSRLDEPDPLLPIDCQQVKGERIQEILVGHCQVSLANSPDAKAHVLFMNADLMDQVAQRDLLSVSNLEQLQIRMISTSRRSLLETADFDSRLAHRLCTLELKIPDLEERKADIPFLAQNILEKEGGRATSVSKELLQSFQVYPWKSDFSELETVINSAAENSTGAEISLADCPHDFRMALKALDSPMPKVESIDLDQMLSDIEKELIERAIKVSNGNKTNAARMLGITRARLHRRIADSSEGAQE